MGVEHPEVQFSQVGAAWTPGPIRASCAWSRSDSTRDSHWKLTSRSRAELALLGRLGGGDARPRVRPARAFRVTTLWWILSRSARSADERVVLLVESERIFSSFVLPLLQARCWPRRSPPSSPSGWPRSPARRGRRNAAGSSASGSLADWSSNALEPARGRLSPRRPVARGWARDARRRGAP